MKNYSYIFRLFFLLFCLPAFSQTNEYYTPDQTKAFYAMLDLDFAKAKVSKANPTALDFHLKSLATCMESFLYCDKQKFQIGKSLEVKWLDSLAKTPECAAKRFAKAQIKLHWAFMSFAYDEKLSAGISMRQAYLILKENIERYPEHKPTQLYLGLINTFLAEIPDNFQWITNMIGLKGDAEMGQKMIQSAKGYHEVLDFERQVWLLVKRPQYEEQEKFLLQTCDELVAEFGKYPTTKAVASYYYLKNKNVEKSATMLSELNFEKVTLLNYIKGLVAYHSLDFKTSNSYFKEFLKNTRSENFKKDVLLRLAHMSYLENDSLQAIKYLTGIKRKGNLAFYADKAADKQSSEKLPIKALLKARILFDGGNWEEAKLQLSKFTIHNKIEKTEYYYRMARIEQELNNLEHSKRCYKSCIGFCPKENVYYGPFASLYLAEIYMKESNKVLALHYLNTSHDFSNFEYRQSFLSKNAELKKRITN